jgi:hypothetical protein
MTEVRANVRATGAASPPPLSASGSAPTSKLRPTAKEFVFNSAAPAWTPTKPAAAPAPAAAAGPAPSAVPGAAPAPSVAPVAAAVAAPVAAAVAAAEAAPTSKSSVLKPSAKAFVPSCKLLLLRLMSDAAC